MDMVHPRCAGLDVSKRDVKVCVRIQKPGRARATSTVTTWGAVTNQILALRDHLVAEEVTLVVMEATSDYWKPFYFLLDDGPFEVMLVNAGHVKNLPGRKTDVSDATWLAQLGAHGLVRGSFVPPEPVRQLRDLTRTRTTITRERAREIQRLEKLLEDAGFSALWNRPFSTDLRRSRSITRRNPRPMAASHGAGGRVDSSSRFRRVEDGKRSESSRSTHSWPIVAARQMAFGSVAVTAKQKTRAPSLPS
jgi:hypothetical protein